MTAEDKLIQDLRREIASLRKLLDQKNEEIFELNRANVRLKAKLSVKETNNDGVE